MKKHAAVLEARPGSPHHRRWAFLSHLFAGVLAALMMSQTAHAAGDWVNDWFDQSTSSGPSSLNTQERGYYNGGSLSGRWRMTNDYLLTLQPPRIQAGCGGIDLFGGAFSYLDTEYLVEKFQRIIQAAPAFAFELAMQEYCKPCSSAMQTLEQITDYLNSIQVNDCRMSKQVAALAVNGDTSVFDGMRDMAAQGKAIWEGAKKNTQDVQDSIRDSGGASPTSQDDALSQCPTEFKTVFTNGSVVGNAANLVGLSAYADLARGLIGDVNVGYDAAMKSWVVMQVQPCPGNDQIDGFDLVVGKMDKRAPVAGGTAGACTTASSSPISTSIADKLNGIASKMSVGGAALLSPDDKQFLAQAPFPLYNLLRDATAMQNVSETVDTLVYPLSTAYAARMFDDLLKMTNLALVKASEVAELQKHSTGDPMKCDVRFIMPALDLVQQMREKSLKYREMAKQNYAAQIADLNTNIAYSKSLLEQRQRNLQTSTGVAR